MDALIEAFLAFDPDSVINYQPTTSRAELVTSTLVAVARQLAPSYPNYIFECEILTPAISDAFAQEFAVCSIFLGLSTPDLDTVLAHEGSNAWIADGDSTTQRRWLSSISRRSDELQKACEHGGYSFGYVAG